MLRRTLAVRYAVGGAFAPIVSVNTAKGLSLGDNLQRTQESAETGNPGAHALPEPTPGAHVAAEVPYAGTVFNQIQP